MTSTKPNAASNSCPTSGTGEPRAAQIVRLKQLTGLSNARIGELLGVTRTNVPAWLRGQAMRRAHEEHLLQVLAVVEGAARRFRSAERTRLALLTPVGPERPRPFDYLRDRSHLIAGGLLQNAPGADEPSPEPSRAARELPLDDRLAALEELNPTPRFEIDEDLLA
jgi:DNA-binding transcriptional regulator YiaG